MGINLPIAILFVLGEYIMKISFNRYINNPEIIKGMATNHQRKLIRQDYERRFDAVLVREAGTVAYYLFKDTKVENRYYAHLMIPSETTNKLYYDVVIELTLENPEQLVSDMSNYTVRFFANDPAFVFTWAYSFNKKDLIINWLKPKLNKRCLTDKPVIRNPSIQTGYVKSIYFAYYYMKLHQLFNALSWSKALPLNKSIFLKTVMNSDDKLVDNQRFSQIQKRLKQQQQEAKLKAPNTRDMSRYTSERMKTTPTAAYAAKASILKPKTLSSKLVKRSRIIKPRKH